MHLIELHFERNQLTGSIPPGITNLVNLTEVHFVRNNLSGPIPQGFDNLTNLQELSLNQNSFTFSGMEILPSLGIDTLHYAPQDSIPIFNNGSFLSVEAGGTISNNHYTWFKNGIPQVSIDGSNTYIPSSSGWYHSEVSNDIVTNPADSLQNLILKSRAIYYVPEPVYPGDFNFDGIVNNIDLLFWGMAENETDTARLDATLEWIPQQADNWPSTVYAINNKHQDGDGNGIVNHLDIQALVNNYDSTHNYTPLEIETSSDNYNIVALPIQASGELRYEIHLEQNNTPPTLHGFACSIYFGALDVASVSLDISNSCLQPQQYIHKYNEAVNKLDIALTRTDKTDIVCTESIITFIVITEDIATDDPIIMGIANGTKMCLDKLYAIANGGYAGIYSEASGSEGTINLSANITHQGCNNLGSATIHISGGMAPYNINWSNGATTIRSENLLAGMYTATVTDAQGLSATMNLMIAEPMSGCNGSCPAFLNLINEIPENTYRAGAILNASAVIGNGKSVSFKAGVSILLEAGFEVKQGASFGAAIEACEN